MLPEKITQAGAVAKHDSTFKWPRGQDTARTVFCLTFVPEFQALAVTNSTLSLTWSTEAGAVYQLQYNSNLSSGNWTNLGIPVPATGATLSTTDSVPNGAQRFYRLVLSP
jgi:hypothetical protein